MRGTLERSALRFLSRNKARKRAYYEIGEYENQTRQSTHHPRKISPPLRVTEATSRFPERDALILLLGITCGMRITEIARLNVHHVLTKPGIRREEIALPGSITKGCRARCVFLAHPHAVEAFDR